MIPILYPAGVTSFTNNGLGRLTDCIRCEVTEERNGVYECEFEYPIDGIHYHEIQEGRIISVTHDEQGDRQPFEIYRHTAPISGVVTFYAQHISYKLSNVILKPFTAASVTEAFMKFKTETLTYNPFTFWTDKVSVGSFEVTVPVSARKMLGGTQGSILDAFGGGEYEFDNFAVKLYAHRGNDNGVTIRYGKNLTDLEDDFDALDIYNAVIPYWEDTENGTCVYGNIVEGSGGIAQREYWTNEDDVRITNENGVELEFDYAVQRVITMDLTDQFEEQPTAAQLEARALTIIESNTPWIPKRSITVDFVALWQTDEYADAAPLERVQLCDTVTIYYEALGVNATAQVITTVYDVLADRYSKIELGEAKTSFAEVIMADTEERLENVPTISMMDDAIEHATALISGGLGGYVVINTDANGFPNEILIMDTPDIHTAVNVWRFNYGGLGHSHSGYNGPYDDVALTMDGQINAAMVTVGTMLANRIHGGILSLGGADNGNGIIRIYNADGDEIGYWTKDGIYTESLTAENYVYVDGDATSYLKIPIGGSTSKYLELSSNGFSIEFETSSVENISFLNYSGQYWPVDTQIVGLSYSLRNSSTKRTVTSVLPGLIDMIYSVTVGNTTENKRQYKYDLDGIDLQDGEHNRRFTVDVPNNTLTFTGKITSSQLTVTGTKNRVVSTPDYSDRLLYSYETPSPMFGDVGEGEISEDGYCYVTIDGIFAETVSLTQYQVFLQKYGEGDAYVAERNGAYFIVRGTPGLAFGWELKAKQAGFNQLRLDIDADPVNLEETDYGFEAAVYINELKEGRLIA